MADISSTFKRFDGTYRRNCRTVEACCVLHNFVRARDGVQFDDILTVNGFDEMHSPSSNIIRGRTANDIRDQFADYFISPEGELPWQYTNI